jgi:hypothetical protein
MQTPTATVEELAAQCRTQLDVLRLLKQTRASEDIQRRTAQEYIRLHYAWQKARYGKVRTRLSVAALLR